MTAGTQVRSLGDRAKIAGDQARERMSDLGAQIQGTVQNVGDRAQDHVGGLRDDILKELNLR
jgi:hypothetical protein